MNTSCVDKCDLMFDLSVVCFSMEAIRGSRSGSSYTERAGQSDEGIHGIIVSEVALAIREAIP